MQEQVVRDAVRESAARGDVLDVVQSLAVVYCMSWPYDDPVGRLAERLAIAPRHRGTSTMSGTSAQSLAVAAAHAIEAGELDVAVVVGAEALATKRVLKRAGERPPWSHRADPTPDMPFEWPFHPEELSHEVFQAYATFALRDVARRAHRHRAPAAHLEDIGALLAPMTVVASQNPAAWDHHVRTASELVAPSPDNRIVASPYRKHTVAVMDVDMAAALIVASDEAADRLGVPVDRRVYLRAAAEADDARYVAEHPDLWRSPAMEWCAAAVLEIAGCSPAEIRHMDLYSCFASSVQFALDALGIDADRLDGRDLTVTGGLPFAGGPACNYLAHSITAMVDRLRSDPSSLGLTTGVGMHMTKHSWALWSTEPPLGQTAPRTPSPAPEVVPILDEVAGPATIAAATVLHGRDGAPTHGLAVCDLDGGRAYAMTRDPDVLARWEGPEEIVGERVVLQREGRTNVVRTGGVEPPSP